MKCNPFYLGYDEHKVDQKLYTERVLKKVLRKELSDASNPSLAPRPSVALTGHPKRFLR